MKPVKLLIFIAVCVTASVSGTHANEVQRPFYIIGHMANAIYEMDDFIEQGANAVEVDVQFSPDGSAVKLFHGIPCDAYRICNLQTPFVDYLRAAAVRSISLLFFDLKTANLNEVTMRLAGIDIARKLIEHFWNRGGANISVILCVPHISNRPLLETFIVELRELDPSKLQQVSYDVSADQNLGQIAKMYQELNVTAAWQGDGITNFLEAFYPIERLVFAMKLRDQGNTVFKKVYRWTVDSVGQLRHLINLGVDGVITNVPLKVHMILKKFERVRAATRSDSINEWSHH